jgi:hypothetical protein
MGSTAVSDKLSIRFEGDMPASAVEVLGADSAEVKTLAMRPNMEQTIDIPSERSIVRVRLPSGRSVTLPRRDDLDYVISRADLEQGVGYASSAPRVPIAGEPRSLSDVRVYQDQRATASAMAEPTWLEAKYETAPSADEDTTVALGLNVRWDPPVTGKTAQDGDELAFQPRVQESHYKLFIELDNSWLAASLPGSLAAAYVRADDIGEGGTVVTVRVSSTSQFANTVGPYLARGDYNATEAMADWAEEAEDSLQSKMRDPFSAALAGYVLLRLERYDMMHDWARNLADWFPDLSDGCVLWAMQSLHQHADSGEATRYLLEAARRGWPVYTEGVGLLSESLRRLGDVGLSALQALDQEHGDESGSLVRSSPFTARTFGTNARDDRPITFDLGYDPLV